MTIDEVRAWFVGRGWGITPGDQLFYERLATILEAGESIELAVPLNYNDAMGKTVLTDRRLIFVGNSIITGMVVESVNRADIQGASLNGLLITTLAVRHAGGTLKLSGSKAIAKQLMAALGCWPSPQPRAR